MFVSNEREGTSPANTRNDEELKWVWLHIKGKYEVANFLVGMFTRYHNWEAGRSFRSHSIDQDEDKVESY